MDDRRFDALVKALARDGSRRSVLKGMLGLGGAAVAGGALLESGAEAARRPAPTPKPVKCPGTQTWDGNACVCLSPPAPGTHVCGPDCCNGLPGDPPSTTHTECCDNACCAGTCYGEELCCPTNPDASGLASHQICEGASGAACCGIEQYCCPVDGEMTCSDTPCDEPTECDLCASADDCCFINEQFVACVDLTVEGACCTAATCGLEDFENCLTSACTDFECRQVSTCVAGEVCCDGECVAGEACPLTPLGGACEVSDECEAGLVCRAPFVDSETVCYPPCLGANQGCSPSLNQCCPGLECLQDFTNVFACRTCVAPGGACILGFVFCCSGSTCVVDGDSATCV